MPDLQLPIQLPIHLQYRRDEDVVRAEHELSQVLEATARKIQTSNHIQPKQLAEQHMMPIFAHMMQFFALQNADMLRFITAALLHQQGDAEELQETVVGIPADDADSIIEELGRINKFLERVVSLSANKKEELEAVKKEAKQLRTTVSDLAKGISDLTLYLDGDEEGGDGDDELFEFADEEEEEAPLIEEDDADKPLIEEENDA